MQIGRRETTEPQHQAQHKQKKCAPLPSSIFRSLCLLVCLAAEVHAGASIRVSGAQQVIAEEGVEEETETFWVLNQPAARVFFALIPPAANGRLSSTFKLHAAHRNSTLLCFGALCLVGCSHGKFRRRCFTRHLFEDRGAR